METLKTPDYGFGVLDHVAEQCRIMEAKDGAAVSGEAASSATLGSLASADDLPAPHRVTRARVIEAKRGARRRGVFPDRDVEVLSARPVPTFTSGPGTRRA